MAVLIGKTKISEADRKAWREKIDKQLAIQRKALAEKRAKMSPEELEESKKGFDSLQKKMQDQGW